MIEKLTENIREDINLINDLENNANLNENNSFRYDILKEIMEEHHDTLKRLAE